MDLLKLLHGFVKVVTWICAMYFSPFVKQKQSDVWPIFQSLLKLLLWIKGQSPQCNAMDCVHCGFDKNLKNNWLPTDFKDRTMFGGPFTYNLIIATSSLALSIWSSEMSAPITFLDTTLMQYISYLASYHKWRKWRTTSNARSWAN